jgi:hypothetical protein
VLKRKLVPLFVLVLVSGTLTAQERRPMSPHGSAETQVGGKWTVEKEGAEPRYTGGKWIEIDYSRPIKRGRADLFGSGADYGKKILDGAPLWRLGANQTTRLKTEVPLEIGGKKLEPGTYSLFVELKENAWTLVVSKQEVQEKYDPANKTATWGSYNYDPKMDVARAAFHNTKLQHSVDQLTIGFTDVSDKGGQIAVGWDHEAAFVPFTVK